MSDLAIVIPAYKDIFFEKALNSIASQTNKNFTVYIGDDFSPFDLQKIIEKYSTQIEISYHRFSANIGSKNLVHQWTRCISLTKNEKWLWLFSDDDLMDENCVEVFYQTIKKNNDFDVYRFNTIVIDKNDTVIREGPFGPEMESSAQMAYNLLKGHRGNSMPDHIFSRNIYNKCGGFVFTDYAQGADWAMSILFSKEKGIYVLPDAKIYWRLSGINISSVASANKSQMINGHLQFINWAAEHFKYLKTAYLNVTYDMMLDALKENLKSLIIYHYKGLKLNNMLPLFKFYHKKLQLSYYESLRELIRIERYHNPFINKSIELITSVKKRTKRIFITQISL